MKRIVVAALAAALVVVRPAFAQDEPADPSSTPAAAPKGAAANGSPGQPDAPETTPSLSKLVTFQPFASIVGGAKLDTVIESPEEHRQGRLSAIMLSDFGLSAKIGRSFGVVSELMANGGSGFELHGSSAWAGQAQLEVFRQLVRYEEGSWMAEVGRVIDEGSVDFVSDHVQDTLLQDTATIEPLLYGGFTLGNGVRSTFEVVNGLRIGLSLFAGNPVSNTASLQVGGSFPPFDRFYIQPYQNVKQTPDNSPDDTFQMMMLSPSLLYTSKHFDARAELQSYVVDANTNSQADQNIHGYNARETMRVRIGPDDLVSLFQNAAFDRNDTVDPNDVARIAAPKYQSVLYGGGIDFNFLNPLLNIPSDRPSGLGVQYERVQYQVGTVCVPGQTAGCVTNLHFLNVGATYWLNHSVALGARFALWLTDQFDVHDEGERSVLLTMRAQL